MHHAIRVFALAGLVAIGALMSLNSSAQAQAQIIGGYPGGGSYGPGYSGFGYGNGISPGSGGYPTSQLGGYGGFGSVGSGNSYGGYPVGQVGYHHHHHRHHRGCGHHY